MNTTPSSNAWHLPKRLPVIVLTIAVACNQNPNLAYAKTLRQRTVPPHGTTTSIEDLRRTNASIGFTWNVLSPEPWERYCDWIVASMASDFILSAREPNILTFTRRISGDLYRLECRRAASDTGLTVHVTLTAAAD